MNKLITCAVILLGFAAQASTETVNTETLKKIGIFSAQQMQVKRVLNWHNGDALNFNLVVKNYPVGNISLKYESETQKEHLITETIGLAGKEIAFKVGYDKATGRVTSISFQGVTIPVSQTEDPKIISQNDEKITVPAGEYDTSHVVIEMEKGQSEIWLSPELPLGGTLKTAGKIKDLTIGLELASFAHGDQ